MKITKEEVAYVANLARLEIDDASMERFVGQIGTILEYVETLNKLDTEGAKPTSHALSLPNAFREDQRTDSIPRDSALANAPEKENGCFSVPRVIG